MRQNTITFLILNQNTKVDKRNKQKLQYFSSQQWPKITSSCHPRSTITKMLWKPVKGIILKESFINNDKVIVRQ
jgi:hypothetical protein